MPILPPVSNATQPTIQQIIDYARSFPQLPAVLGSAAGYSQQPAITIANDVLMRILAQGMDWKWNRSYVPAFLSVPLQQDYVTQITDMGWLEAGDYVDINNTANTNNGALKPVYALETVRELPRSSRPGNPFNASFLPNKLATMGQWQPNTLYPCVYGQAQAMNSPIQQFIDDNGNILFIDSTVLSLSQNSPGYAGSPIVLPANSPYGTTGSDKPALPPDSAPGTTVVDGSVTWTVADPDGYAIRVSSVPAQYAWLFRLVYQKKAPTFTDIRQTVTPIPSDYMYLFRQGFIALALEHAGAKEAPASYAKWEEALMTALRAADRETEEFSFYPGQSIMGGSSVGSTPGTIPPGAGYPFTNW